MKIRVLVHVAGEGFALTPGEETDRFSDDEAMRLVKKNAAVLVDPQPAIETAVEVPHPATETRVEKSPLVPERLGVGRKGKRG